MTSSNVILLLQIIRSRGDVGPLVARGLEYSQIAELLRETRSVGLVARTDDGDVLTDSGSRLLAESGKRNRPGEPVAGFDPP
jgi:hypothetical protein